MRLGQNKIEWTYYQFAWLSAADQHPALFRGTEAATRYAKDRALDENLFAGGGGAGHHAGRDHCGHGPLRHGILGHRLTV